VVPEALAEPILTLEGVKLEIVEFGEGESKHIAAVYVLQLKSLLAADLVYNQAHLYLQERHLESWLVRLNELETFAKDRVVRSIQGTERPQVLNSLGSTRLHPRFRGRNKERRCENCRATDAGQVSGIPRTAVPDGFQHSFLLSVSICPLGLVARETSLKPIIRRRCRKFPHANESDSRVSIRVGLRNTGT